MYANHGRQSGRLVMLAGEPDIGKTRTAQELAAFTDAQGAQVLWGDVLEEEGRITEAQINESGGECLFLTLDVTDQTIWKEVVAATVSRFGKLDVLVNNAGVGGYSNLEETSESEWDRVMAINAKGVFLGTQAAIPEMRRAGGGSIINISSQLGLVGVDNSSPQYQAPSLLLGT